MTSTPPLHWLANGAVSIGAVIIGALWLLDPGTYPYGPDSSVSAGLNAVMSPQAGGWLLVTLGLLGIGTALAGIRSRRVGGWVLAQVAGYALVFCDASLLSSLGYLVAVPLPFLVAGLLVVGGVRCRRLRYVLLIATGLLVAVTAVNGVLAESASAYLTYLGNVGRGFGSYAGPIAWAWAMAGMAGCWIWTGIVTQREQFAVERRQRWMLPPHVNRWGRQATYVAALGAVPYGLLRLTWLTPWPMGGGNGELLIDELDTSTRVLGALFVLPSALSVILVLGLVHRWGEVVPPWVPVIGGRDVPVRAAVIPGTLIGAVLTLAAPGMLAMGFTTTDSAVEAVIWCLVFPLFLWGPALIAAVLAYWLRRTAPSTGRGGGGAVPHHHPRAIPRPVRRWAQSTQVSVTGRRTET